MKKLEELGISPAPWQLYCVGSSSKKVISYGNDYGEVKSADKHPLHFISLHDKNKDAMLKNALLYSASPELYEALFDCCEEVNGHDAPRCYGCRRGEDGHCMALKTCKIYAALAKASGERID